MPTNDLDAQPTRQERRERRLRNRRKMAMHGRGMRKAPRPKSAQKPR